jgi:hypothetical protein
MSSVTWRTEPFGAATETKPGLNASQAIGLNPARLT